MKTKLTLLLLILPAMAWAQNVRISDPIGPKTKSKSVSVTTATDDPVLLRTPALGQATMANSQPVTLASDQPAVPVSGTVSTTAAATYTVGPTALQSAATGTGNGTAMNVTGLTSVTVQPSGTFSATYVFEGSVNGTNYFATTATQIGDSALGLSFQSTNQTGAFNVDVRGLASFRCRISSYSSGSVTLTAIGIADGGVNRVVNYSGTGANINDGISNGNFWAPFGTANGAGTTGVPSVGLGYNGSTFDRLRVATTFKTFTISASSSETTIWTPTSGKKFRVLGYHLFSNTATVLTFRDNTAGTTILLDGVAANTRSNTGVMGNGILSAAANNVLTLQCGTASTVNGTVFGTEE